MKNKLTLIFTLLGMNVFSQSTSPSSSRHSMFSAPKTDNAVSLFAGTGNHTWDTDQPQEKFLCFTGGITRYLASRQQGGGWFGLRAQFWNKLRMTDVNYENHDTTVIVPAVVAVGVEIIIPNHLSHTFTGSGIVATIGTPGNWEKPRDYNLCTYVGIRGALTLFTFKSHIKEELLMMSLAINGGISNLMDTSKKFKDLQSQYYGIELLFGVPQKKVKPRSEKEDY